LSKFLDFMKQKKLAINNPLIREILRILLEKFLRVDEDIPISIPRDEYTCLADWLELDGIAH